MNKRLTAKTAGRPQRARAAASRVQAQAMSPLALRKTPKLPPLAGVQLAVGAAGIRYKDRADTLLVTLAPGTEVAGVFTNSRTASAPVDWCRKHVRAGFARALVANSGNANAFTGRAGIEAVRAVADSTAAVIGCGAREVFLASTGVIGEPLPAEKITRVLPQLAQSGSGDAWQAAAEAIMTTDTYPKLATASAMIDGCSVDIHGIAKGSGMIAPDMATLLSFVFTDATLPAPILQELLSEAVKPSFNSITVDSDTSTSDTLLLFATGQGARHTAISKAGDKRLADFRSALGAVLLDLALQVVRDGEGAQKLITVDVKGAVSDDSAQKVALSIANSPLVKTAIAGGDANWGRVVMAIGKAGESADRDKVKIAFGEHVVAEKGARAANYNEAVATRAVSCREVTISIDLGLGRGRARIYTCDLTEGYVRINGSYRS